MSTSSGMDDYLLRYNASKVFERHCEDPTFCTDLISKSKISVRYVFESIPTQHRTAELCALAVTRDGLALEFVPEELKTAELYALAVTQSGLALRLVPKELKTAELCALAVTQSGLALELVPKELKTAELCALAVTQDGYALRYVPKELQTLISKEKVTKKWWWL